MALSSCDRVCVTLALIGMTVLVSLGVRGRAPMGLLAQIYFILIAISCHG